MDMQTIRLLLLDDHREARKALAQSLCQEVDIEVSEMPASALDALAKAMQLNPDVVLFDPKTTTGKGIEICQDLLSHVPGSRVVTLSSTASAEDSRLLADIGVSM